MPNRPQPQADMVVPPSSHGRPETGPHRWKGASLGWPAWRATGDVLPSAPGDAPGGAASRAAGNSAGSEHLIPPDLFCMAVCADGPGGQDLAAPAVSIACSSVASSAVISPIATRSRGLMNPSLTRK